MELTENENLHQKADRIETGDGPNVTETTRRRYQRNTRFYDLIEGGAERRHGPWRKE